MKAKKKSFRKEIRQPDEFETFWGNVLRTALERKRDVLLGASGLVLILVLVFAGWSYVQHREARASTLLAEAQSLLSSVPSLEPGTTGPAGPSPEDRENARAVLEDLVQNFGGTHAGQLGRILVGNLYYEDGLYDKAAQTYQEFLDGGKEPAELKDMALEGLAYALEAKGSFQEALGAYEKLTRSKQRYVQGWAWLGAARSHELLGQPEQALEAYRKFLADHPFHPEAEEIKANVSRLSSAATPPSTSMPDSPEH